VGTGPVYARVTNRRPPAAVVGVVGQLQLGGVERPVQAQALSDAEADFIEVAQAIPELAGEREGPVMDEAVYPDAATELFVEAGGIAREGAPVTPAARLSSMTVVARPWPGSSTGAARHS
jgi:hypothetical protein